MKYGRGDWIRTSDFFVPNEALYQAEPHPDSHEREKMSNSPTLGKRESMDLGKRMRLIIDLF